MVDGDRKLDPLWGFLGIIVIGWVHIFLLMLIQSGEPLLSLMWSAIAMVVLMGIMCLKWWLLD